MNIDPANLPGDDRHADANLRAIGPSLGVPAPLTDTELDAITGGSPASAVRARHARSPRERKVHTMRRTRFVAMGSAMLVALAAGAAVLWTSGKSQQARAAAIMNSLRASSIRGVDMTITGLGDTELSVSGQVRVRFVQPIDVGALLAFGEAQATAVVEPRIDQAYAQLDVAMGAGGPLPGATGHIEFATSESATWVFIQAPELGANVAEVAPPLALFRGVLQNGVVINLGQEIRSQVVAMNEPEPPAGQGPPTGLSVHTRADVVVLPSTAPVPGEHSRRISVSLSSRPSAEAGAVAGSTPAPAADTAPDDAARERQLGGLVGSMLSGDAGPAQLQEFQRLLSDSAHTEVTSMGGGLYVLRASDPDSTSGEELRVAYQEGEGIRYAEIGNLPDPHGGRAGVVRLVFATEAIEPAMLDAQRVIVPGTTYQYDLPAIMGLFGQR